MDVKPGFGQIKGGLNAGNARTNYHDRTNFGISALGCHLLYPLDTLSFL
jgi:hypothetical protein